MFKPRSLVSKLVLAVCALAVFAAAPAAAAVTSSVDTKDVYLTKQVETYTFTVNHTETINNFRITRPSTRWTITGCGPAPAANWAVVTATNECIYNMGTTGGAARAPGNETFTVTATTSAGNDVAPTEWDVDGDTAGTDFGGSGVVAGAAAPAGLATRGWNFEVQDAVITTALAAPNAGAPCPDPAKPAPAASSRVVVVCGRQWGAGSGSLTPTTGTLAGTMFSTATGFTGGVLIPYGGATPVVLGKFSSATITSSVGAGKTAIPQVGLSNRMSPPTTLTGYEATVAPTTVDSVSGTSTYGSGTATLTATLRSEATGVAGKSIEFTLNGIPVGSATTLANGVATKSVSLSNRPVGSEAGAVEAEFDATGDATYTGNTGSGALETTPRPVDGSFTAPDKTYDGTTVSNIVRSLDAGDIVDGDGNGTADEVSLAGTGAFADPDVSKQNNGTINDKTVTGSGFSLTGADAGNYTLVMSNATDLAKINLRSVDGSFTAADKVFDDETDATISTRVLDPADIAAGDEAPAALALSGTTANFANENVSRDVDGNVIDKVVTGSGFALTGTEAGNYTLVMDTTDDAKINPRHVDGSFVAADKTYNGTPAATISSSSLDAADLVPGGNPGVTLGGTQTAAFADANVDRDTNGDVIDKVVTGAGFVLTGTNAPNYTLLMDTTDDAKINPRPVDGSFTADDKVYDGTTDAVINGSSLEQADIVSGEESGLALGGTQTASFADANVSRAPNGTVIDKVVTGAGFVLTGVHVNNYELVMDLTDDAKITPVGLNGSFTPEDKVYDGDTTATVLTRTLDPTGIVSGDESDVSIDLNAGAADFASADVARDIDGNVIDQLVTTSGFKLDGAKADNYDLTIGTQMAKITPKSVGGSFTADDKVYDGTTDAVINGSSLEPADIVGVDDVGIDHAGASAAFANKNVAYDVDGVTPIDKVVTGAGFVLTGTTAGNYSVNMDTTADAMITPRPIGDGEFTAADKEYDGTTAATVSGSSFLDDVPGDAVSLTGTATFADKEIGNDKVVTLASPALTGADAANYTLGNVDDTATADITPKVLTGSFTAADKVYDGGTGATVTGRSVPGKVGTEDVSLVGGTASFASDTVGNDKAVTLTGASLDGANKGNYTLGSVSTALADITRRSVTGSFTAADKDFDGTTAATITARSLSGQVVGDAVALTGGTATFNNANPGVGKPVTGTGFGLGGADAGNYTLAGVGGTSATIRQRDPEDTPPGGGQSLSEKAADLLGGDVKKLGLDLGGFGSAFALESQGSKIKPVNQTLFAIGGCVASCTIDVAKTLVLTGEAGASAAATKKIKLKAQKLSLAKDQLALSKLKLTKKQKKAIKKANKAKLVIKATLKSGTLKVTGKKTYRLKKG